MILTGQTYSNSFYSFNLNKKKYEIIKNKAILINEFKNNLSIKISENLDKYTKQSKYDFLKEFNTQISGLTGQDIQNAIVDVHTCYSNKFKQINNKINFRVQDKINVVYYKKDTKFKKIGQIKSFEIKMKSTKLTKVLTFISKYGSENTIGYLKERLKTETEEGKILFFKDILFYIEKYGFDRLFKLGNTKKIRLINKYKTPAEFESLSFRTLSRVKDDILVYNKRFGSEIKTFIVLGGYFDEKGKSVKLSIPVKYSKTHHGSIKDYLKRETSYTMCIERKRVRIVLAKEGDRYIPETKVGKVLGVDTNVKHNLFYLSSDSEIDYDRKMISDYVKFLKHLDKIKERKEKLGLPKEEISKHSSKNKAQLNKWNVKLENMITSKCNQLVKYSIDNGYDHIAMENLGTFGWGFTRNDELEGFKYSRLVKLLSLTTIKDIVRGIAYKKDLSVTFVQPEYTSKKCNSCGCIDDRNRRSQEEFECVACGYKTKADYNSSLNIEDIISVDVLRDLLLIVNDNGEYVPKSINKYDLKHILSHSCNDKQSQIKSEMNGDVTICHNFL